MYNFRLSRRLALVLTALCAIACSEETLTVQVANLKVIPELGRGQTALENPVGINVGEIPLFGIGYARFTLENDSAAIVKITGAEVTEPTGGTFSVLEFPAELASTETGPLVIEFVPTDDEVAASAIIKLSTNTGTSQNSTISIRIEGQGYFVGEPKLEVVYGGQIYPVEGNCTAGTNGQTECLLDTLDFGNIPLNSTGTQSVRLRNNPLVDTCRLPALEDGSPDCSPVCVITFDKNPAAHDLGVGFQPANQGFNLVGAASVPFRLAPANAACADADDLIRGELELLVNFQAGAEEGDHVSAMILESNAPNASVVEIPLAAAARNAPIAVAKIRECDEIITTNCSDSEALEPLNRVFLDGTESYDPANPDDPSAIVGYRWIMIEAPSGADPGMFDIQGATTDTMSMWMPLAGRYKVRLHVTNNVGIESGVSDTSDVVFTALPDSRLHIQLVWDSATTDHDLHMVYADGVTAGGEAYNHQWDCYWLGCRPGCDEFEDNPCAQPTRWFPESAAFEGSNPRLDIDDTNGLGPENINIDEPGPGSYHIYVHYYAIGSGESSVRTLATIRIYADGYLHADYRRGLEKNNLWAVANIVWSADGEAVVTPAEADSPNVIGSVRDLPYVPADGTGFDFGEVF